MGAYRPPRSLLSLANFPLRLADEHRKVGCLYGVYLREPEVPETISTVANELYIGQALPLYLDL